MNIDEVIGYFTYRSFVNRPVGAPNDILWGEGELLLLISDEGAVTGTLAFPADQGAPQKDFMDFSGTVTTWEPLSFRFIGKGRAGSAISDYEYEYDCEVAHEWDSATPPQRLCLVGTVRRNKDHGQAKAGATASFFAVKRDFVEPRLLPGVALIRDVVTMLSERVHRLRHTVWHTLRSDWQSPSMTDNDRKRLKNLGWYLTDPPFTRGGALDLTNGAGEDFLYMHRRMIQMVHEVYDKAGQAPPASWKTLPDAGAPQFAYREATDPSKPQQKIFALDPSSSGFMVPPPTKDFLEQVGGAPFFRFNKTSRGLTTLMRNVAANLRNARVLSQLTLGTYGNLIEFTIHNWMHMRWATLSRNPKTGLLAVRDAYDIDTPWDVADNDYLGDFHSSHVNPLFWRLHGWVDDCIDVWLTAHENAQPGQIKRLQVRGVPWFAPGLWVIKTDPFDWPGAGHAHAHTGHDDNEIRAMEQVMAILKEISERSAAAALTTVSPVRRLPGFARFLDVQTEISNEHST
jgi:hypothetical protein